MIHKLGPHALAAIVVLAATARLVACAGLTPAEATLFEAANAGACSGLSLIPVVGPMLAAACPGEEQIVRAAVESATLHPDAGTSTLGAAVAAMVRLDAGAPALGAPLYHRRASAHVRHVGHCPASYSPGQVALAQAWLDAHP